MKKEEDRLKLQLDVLERRAAQNDEIRARVNQQLKVLNISVTFTGGNADTILHELHKLQTNLEKTEKTTKNIAITELEAIFTSLDEQIKKQTQFELDHKRFVADDEKRQQLVETLKRVLEDKYWSIQIVSIVCELNSSYRPVGIKFGVYMAVFFPCNLIEFFFNYSFHIS